MIDNKALTSQLPEQVDQVTLTDLGRIVHRHRWIVVSITLLTILGAALFTWLQTPEYQSEATVQLHGERSARSSALADLGAAAGLVPLSSISGAGIETDMVVMESRRIVEAVVDSLSLHVVLEEPRLSRSQVFSLIQAPRHAEPATVRLRLEADGSYWAELESEDAPGPVLPERIHVGEPFQLGSTTLSLAPHLRGDAPSTVLITIEPFRSAVARVRKALTVTRVGRGTQVIALQYRSEDPILAAEVPNAITEGFIRHKTESNRSETRSRADFLREQIARYETELMTAEAVLQAFREREQIISLRDQASEQVRRFAQLQIRRDELQEERDALRRLVARVRQPGTTGSGDETYRQLASFPVFFSNPTIQNIIRSLIDLENRRADLLVLRTEQNVDVRGIDARIAELEYQLLETAENYLESRENQIASLDATLNQFVEQAGTVPAREVEFARLSRQQELLSRIYGQLQTRLREVEVEEAVDPLDVQLLDPALVPERPARPRRLLNLLLGGFLGFAFGLMAAFGRQALDQTVRSSDDVRLASGGLPVLATIPRIPFPPDASANGKRLRLPRTRNIFSTAGRTGIVVRDAPRSLAAEAYRALRTRVYFRGPHSHSVLMVTSAVAGEGKTTSSANLAAALAQQGVRTLLIDGDLRHGLLHRILGVSDTPGLAEVLSARSHSEAAIVSVPLNGHHLDLLPCGRYPESPAELLGTSPMRDLLDELRARYDRIVIDTPPVGLATDAAVIGSLSGVGTLVVARSGYSSKETFEAVSRELRELDIQITGVIVNDVHPSDGVYGYKATPYRAHTA